MEKSVQNFTLQVIEMKDSLISSLKLMNWVEVWVVQVGVG